MLIILLFLINCHTNLWFVDHIDGINVIPVASDVCKTSVRFPECYPYSCFSVYPPRALYNQWIPGRPECYLAQEILPCGFPIFHDPLNPLPQMSEFWHALGYTSGDTIWITRSTTRQMEYLQIRHDNSPPPDTPLTGVPHHDGLNGNPPFGPTIWGSVP